MLSTCHSRLKSHRERLELSAYEIVASEVSLVNGVVLHDLMINPVFILSGRQKGNEYIYDTYLPVASNDMVAAIYCYVNACLSEYAAI